MPAVGDFEYNQGDILGHGAFALVFRGRRKASNQLVAIKQITLKSVPGKLSNIRQKEIAILKDLKQPNIVQLYDYLETKSDIFLVMEYCNGGDLGDYLNAKKTLSEASIRHLGRHIAGALEALCKLHIIHRDIKPQNLLLSYPTNGGSKKERQFKDATIKLADFGFARYLTGADMAATLCGSPLYMAPEILLGHRYDNKADLWSVGTILFQCLTGTAPFLASNPHALRKKYERESLVPKIPEGTSLYVSDLLFHLLKKNPKERITFVDFFEHPFLKKPSSLLPSSLLPSEPVLLTRLPSQHAKSSPVPIRRHTGDNSSSPSPRYSPHRMSSVDMHSLSPSPASGPPLSHRVGSQGSLPYYSLHSPNSEIVTDQGFILVDLPGSTGSMRRFSSASSTSPGQHSSTAASPAASSGSHSRSSSLNRYTSLTTPFYPAPLRAHHNIPLTTDNSGSNGSTPTGTPNSRVTLSRSNSARLRSDASLGRSPPLPFGRLIQYPQTQYSNSPSSSSPHSASPYFHRKSNSVSPLPTPPSVPSPVGIAPRQLGSSGGGGGMRYAHTSQGSATKLSSLVEEELRQNRNNEERVSVEQSGRRFAGEDFISLSCILHSDDENEEDEENFPLSLTMSLNSSHSNDQEEHDTMSPVLPQTVLPSKTSADHKVKRASSFTRHDLRLSQELADINKRATSLSAHGDPLDPSTPTEKLTYNLQVSSSSGIVTFKPPFTFSGPPSIERDSATRQSGRHSSELRQSRQAGTAGGGSHGSEENSVCLAPLNQSLVLAKELLAMAKARQGPIMLMSASTDLTVSGIATRVQRWSEQMVLYAKCVSILESGLRQYEIELAANNIEPSQILKNVEAEVQQMLQTSIDEAKKVREQEHIFVKDEKRAQTRLISAERLLCLEALDMCKVAVLNELSGEVKECIKKYRRAKLIFHYLLMEAQTPKDRATLHKYLQSVQSRIHHLSAAVV